MNEASASDSNPVAIRPLRIVPDADVFPDRAWVDRLARAATAGTVELYWSPKILEEMARVRLWIWLKRELQTIPSPRGSSAWKSLWRDYSRDEHAWFARVSPYVRVIEDQPPHEESWADPHPDPNDIWLWNAARRNCADIVLTVILIDAPPVGIDGLRQHEGISFMHPRAFMVLLDVWNRIRATGIIPGDLEQEIRDTTSPASAEHSPNVAAEVRVLLDRMAEEARSAPTEADPTS